MLFGVDAHTEYQAGLNIERLAAEGYSFCCVKATQGVSGYVAPATFDDWIRRTRAAGMIPGAYHWLTNADPIAQADRFLARLAPVGGPKGLLLQIDNEDTSSPASADVLRRFVARMNARTGNRPLIMYTGAWWWKPRMGSYNAAALGLKLWDSRYVTGQGPASALYAGVQPSWWQPGYGGWGDTTVLQFSSKGSAGGLVANVDVNAFRGTRSDIEALTGGVGMDPNGQDIIPGQMNKDVFRHLVGMVWEMKTGEVRPDLTLWDGLPNGLWDRLTAIEAKPAGGITDAQIQHIVDALIAAPQVPVQTPDREAMISAAQEAMRRGAGSTPATG